MVESKSDPLAFLVLLAGRRGSGFTAGGLVLGLLLLGSGNAMLVYFVMTRDEVYKSDTMLIAILACAALAVGGLLLLISVISLMARGIVTWRDEGGPRAVCEDGP